MIIMDRTASPSILRYAQDALPHTPHAAAHARSMDWLRKMNAYDRATGLAALRTAPPNTYEWIGSWPFSVAAAINQFYPEVFNDRTGAAMKRFLRSELGQYYRVPGCKL
jgi:hypothetical protein